MLSGSINTPLYKLQEVELLTAAEERFTTRRSKSRPSGEFPLQIIC